MSGERALPGQASLRYLKVEAKRRRAAGEFATLHHAQLAIAREHGQPSWTALRDAVAAAGGATGSEGHALTRLRWIAARFGGAGEPGWLARDEEELRERFTDEFLARFPPDRLVARITELGTAMRGELIVISATPFTARGRLSGHLVAAMTETRPPYRLLAVQELRLGERISARLPAADGTVRHAGPGQPRRGVGLAVRPVGRDQRCVHRRPRQGRHRGLPQVHPPDRPPGHPPRADHPLHLTSGPPETRHPCPQILWTRVCATPAQAVAITGDSGG